MKMVTIYHGTPITPREALLAVCPGRAICVSYHHRQDADAAAEISPYIMYDNGAFSFWKSAMRKGQDWAEDRDWKPYYGWLEERLFYPGRWAVIPDMPGAPSQLNDALLKDWPFGKSKGAPLWHMDGPIERLINLCGQYDRVCLGWVGKGKGIDVPEFHERMAEVVSALGERWPIIHMMRGVQVAFDYPFHSADSTSLAQNGWKYDTKLDFGDKWLGRKTYADKLEGLYRRDINSEFCTPKQRRKYPRAHLGDKGMVGGLSRCGD